MFGSGKGRARTAAIALLLGGAGLAASALPANAALGDCPRGRSCIWEDKDFSGQPWFGRGADHGDLGLRGTGWLHNDDPSSVWNRRSTVSMLLYDREGGQTGGGVACVPRGYAQARLDAQDWEDRVSSFRITAGYCSDFTVNTIIGSYYGYDL